MVTATGISYGIVSKNVKYARLLPELKEVVDNQSIDINVAMKAQDAAIDENGNVDVDNALMLAQAMKEMDGVQRQQGCSIT